MENESKLTILLSPLRRVGGEAFGEKGLQALLLTVLLSIGIDVSAQMNNVVEVESTFTPTVADADKIDMPFDISKFTPTQPLHASYADDVAPTRNYSFVPMQPAVSDAAPTGDSRRFLRLGGGNCNLVDTRAAIGFSLDRKNALDFDLHFGGYSAKVENAVSGGDDIARRFFTTRGAARYTHYLAPQSPLKVGAAVESQAMDGQRNTLVDASAQLTPYKFGDFSIGASVGYGLFAQQHLTNAFFSTRQNRENHFAAALQTAYSIDDANRVGLDLNGDVFSYAYGRFSSANLLDIRPYYAFENDDLEMSIGAHMVATGGVDRKFRVSPDVSLRYNASDDITVFAKAGGGVQTNDYRSLSALTPYWMYAAFYFNEFGTPQLTHQFDYIRSQAGVEWKLAEPFFVRIFGGFDKSFGRTEIMAGNALVQAKGWHWYGNVDLDFTPTSAFSAKASARYNIWHSNYGNNANAHAEAVAWRPIVEAEGALNYRPHQRLTLGADYLLQTFSLRSSLPYHRPVTSNLGASVRWTLPINSLEREGRHVDLFARGDNLLNRSYDVFPSVRTIGRNVLAGVQMTF